MSDNTTNFRDVAAAIVEELNDACFTAANGAEIDAPPFSYGENGNEKWIWFLLLPIWSSEDGDVFTEEDLREAVFHSTTKLFKALGQIAGMDLRKVLKIEEDKDE